MKLFFWLLGFVQVNIKSKEISRFLRLCSMNQIFLWDILDIGEDEISFFMPARKVFQLHSILRKTNTHIEIIKKVGLSFYLLKYKWKIAFCLSGMLAFLTFMFYSSYIWQINVTGNSYITKPMIEDYLYEKQQGIGTAKDKIDTDALEEEFLHDFPEIIWVSISKQGTSLNFVMKERVKIEESLNNKVICEDMIASNEGIVTKIYVRNGTAAVKVGDVVKENDVLIYGYIPIYNDSATEILNYHPIKADGDVEISGKLNYLVKKNSKYTRRTIINKNYHYPSFGTNSVKLDLITHLLPRNQRIRIIEAKDLKLSSELKLPFYLYDNYCYYYKTQEDVHTKEEMHNILWLEYESFVKKMQEKGIQIIGKNVMIEKNGNQYIMKGKVDYKVINQKWKNGVLPTAQ